jgi:hypothetical protein
MPVEVGVEEVDLVDAGGSTTTLNSAVFDNVTVVP